MSYTENRRGCRRGPGSGMKWGFGVSRHKLLYIGWADSKVLLYIGASQVVPVAETRLPVLET